MSKKTNQCEFLSLLLFSNVVKLRPGNTTNTLPSHSPCYLTNKNLLQLMRKLITEPGIQTESIFGKKNLRLYFLEQGFSKSDPNQQHCHCLQYSQKLWVKSRNLPEKAPISLQPSKSNAITTRRV